MLSSGGRDSAICNWDVRKRRDEACVAKVVSHEQESGVNVGVLMDIDGSSPSAF